MHRPNDMAAIIISANITVNVPQNKCIVVTEMNNQILKLSKILPKIRE